MNPAVAEGPPAAPAVALPPHVHGVLVNPYRVADRCVCWCNAETDATIGIFDDDGFIAPSLENKDLFAARHHAEQVCLQELEQSRKEAWKAWLDRRGSRFECAAIALGLMGALGALVLPLLSSSRSWAVPRVYLPALGAVALSDAVFVTATALLLWGSYRSASAAGLLDTVRQFLHRTAPVGGPVHFIAHVHGTGGSPLDGPSLGLTFFFAFVAAAARHARLSVRSGWIARCTKEMQGWVASAGINGGGDLTAVGELPAKLEALRDYLDQKREHLTHAYFSWGDRNTVEGSWLAVTSDPGVPGSGETLRYVPGSLEYCPVMRSDRYKIDFVFPFTVDDLLRYLTGPRSGLWLAWRLAAILLVLPALGTGYWWTTQQSVPRIAVRVIGPTGPSGVDRQDPQLRFYELVPGGNATVTARLLAPSVPWPLELCATASTPALFTNVGPAGPGGSQPALRKICRPINDEERVYFSMPAGSEGVHLTMAVSDGQGRIAREAIMFTRPGNLEECIGQRR